MERKALEHLLSVARGDQPADLVLTNAQIVNVFSGEVQPGQVAISGGYIAGVGQGYQGHQQHDLDGRYLLPGFIDTHMHLESTTVLPYEYARTIVPRGSTTVVADPHEIANVCGLPGVEFLLEASHNLPLSVLFMLPSCVPATHMSGAGAQLLAADLLKLVHHPRVVGLAEFMNVPGAVLGDPQALDKLQAFAGKVINGHAPGLGGHWLQAYVAAGPRDDHESTRLQEAQEKLRAGLRVFIREGTVTRDLAALIPLVSPQNAPRFAFCTDDRHPEDLLDEGHLDFLLRSAIRKGLPPITAIQMATLFAAQAFDLRDRGAVAAGRRADLVVTSSLTNLRAERVYALGQWVAEQGQPVGHWEQPHPSQQRVRNTMHLSGAVSLDIPARGQQVRAIGVVPRQVVTEERRVQPLIQNGLAQANPAQDLLKLAVINRHGSGEVGLGFVQGLGLQRGALGGTVGHDSHNLTVAGADDRSMQTVIAALQQAGGGYAIAEGDQLLGLFPLPIAGLISDQPIAQARQQMDQLKEVAQRLGSRLHDPFMHLAFLPLEVIPHLKLTDKGLVDVERFRLVDLWI